MERRNDLVRECMGWRGRFRPRQRGRCIKKKASEKYNNMFFIATVNKVLLFYLSFKLKQGVSLSKGRQRDKRKG